MTEENIKGLAEDAEFSITLGDMKALARAYLANKEALTTTMGALILCNDSRNRLTRFKSSIEQWVNEAAVQIEKESIGK